MRGGRRSHDFASTVAVFGTSIWSPNMRSDTTGWVRESHRPRSPRRVGARLQPAKAGTPAECVSRTLHEIDNSQAALVLRRRRERHTECRLAPGEARLLFEIPIQGGQVMIHSHPFRGTVGRFLRGNRGAIHRFGTRLPVRRLVIEPLESRRLLSTVQARYEFDSMAVAAIQSRPCSVRERSST